jgi:hypothetical protein
MEIPCTAQTVKGRKGTADEKAAGRGNEEF